MKIARRIENLPPYLFVEIINKINVKRAYSFGCQFEC